MGLICPPQSGQAAPRSRAGHAAAGATRAISRSSTSTRDRSPARDRSQRACRYARAASALWPAFSSSAPFSVQLRARHSSSEHASRSSTRARRRSPFLRLLCARAINSSTGSTGPTNPRSGGCAVLPNRPDRSRLPLLRFIGTEPPNQAKTASKEASARLLELLSRDPRPSTRPWCRKYNPTAARTPPTAHARRCGDGPYDAA